MSNQPPTATVFISYSHADQEWLEELKLWLKPLLRNNTITAWDDTKIQPGQRWRDEIAQALLTAQVGVLLVSPDFINSDFIQDNELPLLLQRVGNGLTIFWIPIHYSNYKYTLIEQFQAAWDPSRPLSSLSKPERDKAWMDICQELISVITS